MSYGGHTDKIRDRPFARPHRKLDPIDCHTFVWVVTMPSGTAKTTVADIGVFNLRLSIFGLDTATAKHQGVPYKIEARTDKKTTDNYNYPRSGQ